MSKHSQRKKERKRLNRLNRHQELRYPLYQELRYPLFYAEAVSQEGLELQVPMVRRLFARLGQQIAHRIANEWYQAHLEVLQERQRLFFGPWALLTKLCQAHKKVSQVTHVQYVEDINWPAAYQA